jgi:hypothetical protein
MRRTILIPTDFTIESLNVLKNVLNKKDEEVVYDIIFLHGLHLSGSITDFLFFSKAKRIESLTNREFEDACLIIKNKYSKKINSMRKDIFTGFTQSAFNNYIEANKVDQAYVCSNYELNLEKKQSFDLLPFIKKSDLTINEVELNFDSGLPEKGKLAQIFYNSASAQ